MYKIMTVPTPTVAWTRAWLVQGGLGFGTRLWYQRGRGRSQKSRSERKCSFDKAFAGHRAYAFFFLIKLARRKLRDSDVTCCRRAHPLPLLHLCWTELCDFSDGRSWQFSFSIVPLALASPIVLHRVVFFVRQKKLSSADHYFAGLLWSLASLSRLTLACPSITQTPWLCCVAPRVGVRDSQSTLCFVAPGVGVRDSQSTLCCVTPQVGVRDLQSTLCCVVGEVYNIINMATSCPERVDHSCCVFRFLHSTSVQLLLCQSAPNGQSKQMLINNMLSVP